MSHYDCPCMEKCPLHWAMSRIGGKWKVQILCSVANAGSIRYNTLRGKLDGISNTVLAAGISRGAGAGGVQPHGVLPAAAAGAGIPVRLGRGRNGQRGGRASGIG